MNGLIDQRVKAKELLEQLNNLRDVNLKEKEKLEKKLNKISSSPEADNIKTIIHNAETIVKAISFINNDGKHTFDSEILSTSSAGAIKLFTKYQNTFSDKEYWENLKYVYILQDYKQIPYELFKSLFDSKRSHKEFLMDSNERLFLENLPEQIKIYRGGAKKEVKKGYGISWTLNKDIAQQFVNRKKHLVMDEMTILQLEISKSEVVAYFNERNEEEIIYLGK
jgi:hypothetical protein